MRKNLTISLLIILFAISCRFDSETREPKTERKINKSAKTQPDTRSLEEDLNRKIGIVDGSIDKICLRTKNGDLKKNAHVSIVTSLNESPQKVFNATVDRSLNESCSRRASESTDQNPGRNFYYLLTLEEKKVEEDQEVYGIGVIQPGSRFGFQDGLANVDLTGDGKAEFFRRCTGFEGVLFAVWTGKPLRGKQIWYSFYYLDYATEPNCKKEDGADEDYGK